MKYNTIRQNRCTVHISEYEFFQYSYGRFFFRLFVFLVHERDEKLRFVRVCLGASRERAGSIFSAIERPTGRTRI